MFCSGLWQPFVLYVQSQQIVNLKMNNNNKGYVGKSQDTRGNVQVCGCVACHWHQIKAAKCLSPWLRAMIRNRQNCSKKCMTFVGALWIVCLFLETDDIRLQSQIWSRWPPSTKRGFPWIFESNCTNWNFFTHSKWFETMFWSRCCWLVSLSSAGYIWIIQALLDVPFWGFQWISNITNTDGCWTAYRIVVGWWEDISLPLSSLHSVWLETCWQRPHRYDIIILVFSITKHTNKLYSYELRG